METVVMISLDLMWKGMAAIFIVMGIIFLVVLGLIRFTRKKA